MVLFTVSEDAVCELCWKLAELRPYGKNNENICFECGQKDIETTIAKINEQFDKLLGGTNAR